MAFELHHFLKFFSILLVIPSQFHLDRDENSLIFINTAVHFLDYNQRDIIISLNYLTKHSPSVFLNEEF